jgi:tetratricopeptide (TPR) repeat protein
MPATTTAAQAEEHFEAGRFDEALAAWQAIADRDPDAPGPRARVAACLLALGRHAEAGDLLAALADTLPGQPMVLYRLAVARAGVDDSEGALDALDRAAAVGLRPAAGIDAEPVLDRLRGRARFVAIRDRIAANDAPTAADPPFRSFDFWVGSWEARTDDGVLQGHNRIERVLGGAALVERWTGATGYRGMSLNRYDRRTATWRQTWVDDQGDIVEFEDGIAADGRVVFAAVDADGGQRRLTFEDGGPDAFRQLSERSADDGRTWTVEYDFRYRRPSAEAEAE